MSTPRRDQAQPDGDQAETRRRVSVQDAARLLDTTVEGVRSRIKRGTLESVRIEGTVYVLLTPDQTDRSHAQAHAQARPGPTGRPGNLGDGLQGDGLQGDGLQGDGLGLHAVLVEELKDRVRSLETQLSEERTANRENRRLLAAALERIPELPPPDTASSEPPGSPISDPEGEGGGEMPPDTGRRPWWQRWFS